MLQHLSTDSLLNTIITYLPTDESFICACGFNDARGLLIKAISDAQINEQPTIEDIRNSDACLIVYHAKDQKYDNYLPKQIDYDIIGTIAFTSIVSSDFAVKIVPPVKIMFEVISVIKTARDVVENAFASQIKTQASTYNLAANMVHKMLTSSSVYRIKNGDDVIFDGDYMRHKTLYNKKKYNAAIVFDNDANLGECQIQQNIYFGSALNRNAQLYKSLNSMYDSYKFDYTAYGWNGYLKQCRLFEKTRLGVYVKADQHIIHPIFASSIDLIHNQYRKFVTIRNQNNKNLELDVESSSIQFIKKNVIQVNNPDPHLFPVANKNGKIILCMIKMYTGYNDIHKIGASEFLIRDLTINRHFGGRGIVIYFVLIDSTYHADSALPLINPIIDIVRRDIIQHAPLLATRDMQLKTIYHPNATHSDCIDLLKLPSPFRIEDFKTIPETSTIADIAYVDIYTTNKNSKIRTNLAILCVPFEFQAVKYKLSNIFTI